MASRDHQHLTDISAESHETTEEGQSSLPLPEVTMGEAASTYTRPRTRQRVHRSPPALDVPDINDDAAERKRVLNVLAQRRYSATPPLDLGLPHANPPV